MKVFAGVVLLFMAKGLAAQVDSTKTMPRDSVSSKNAITGTLPVMSLFDKIRLQSGDSLIVEIIAETQTEVAFKYPLNTMINKVLYTKVKDISYKDGRVRSIVNQNTVSVGTEPDNLWRIVQLTSEEGDVAGLNEIGPVEAKAEGKNLRTSIDLLEKNARIALQKKAVRMNATKVLIKTKNVVQTYGELPSVELKGVAYGK
jgi:hypothetical protein